MQTIDFSHISLTKNELHLLKKLNKGHIISFKEEYSSLYDKGFIQYKEYENVIGVLKPTSDELIITEKGATFLQYLNEKICWYWIPVITSSLLSIAAIIISIIALIV
jgi:hypothetical protein